MQPKVADCTKQTNKTLISQQFDLGLHGSLQNQNSLLVRTERVTCQIDNSSPGAVTSGLGIRIKRMKPLCYACSCWLIISTKDKKSTYCNFPKNFT